MSSWSSRGYLALLAIVLFGVSVTACADESGTPATDSSIDAPNESVDLEGRSYVSVDVRGHDLVAGTEVTLSFESGSVSANAGCNTFIGGASWDEGALLIDGELAGTLIGCSPELQEQDEWLSELLTSSPALALDGTTLTLGDDDSGMTLEETDNP